MRSRAFLAVLPVLSQKAICLSFPFSKTDFIFITPPQRLFICFDPSRRAFLDIFPAICCSSNSILIQHRYYILFSSLRQRGFLSLKRRCRTVIDMMQKLRLMMIHTVLLPVHAYRLLISPLLPRTCIYTPTCSVYAVEACIRHGIIRGILLSAARVTRCHGLYEGGEDPVPDSFSWKDILRRYRRNPKDGQSPE